MKTVLSAVLALTLALTLWSGANGGGEKEVTVKGEVACAKCGLKKETTCMAVVVEKKDKKEVLYYFDADSNKKYHGDVCMETKAGSVIGLVTEKDGKKMIAVKEVKYDKK